MGAHPTMKILYGPPGTGKTWLALREAVFAILPDRRAEWNKGALTDEALDALHSQLVREGRVLWVTFHPSYSYEDFVEGFRPLSDPVTHTMRFEVRKGPFRLLCEAATDSTKARMPATGDVCTAVGGDSKYEVVESGEQGWRLKVRPNRKDQVGEEQEKFAMRSIIDRALDLGFEPKVFSIPGSGEVVPADYGLEGTTGVSGSQLRRTVAEKLGISSSDLSNSAHVAAVMKHIKEGTPSSQRYLPVCLVIDEINRADLSRVFGELLLLLETNKRIGASDERRVHLPYSGESGFGVPPSLSVIGTMNTADRSLSAMDFAMRRRFSFMEIAPNPDLCPSNYGGVDLRACLMGINRRLEVLRGRDYRIGHATLMRESIEATRLQHTWHDDEEGQLHALALTLREKIVPLLVEYFYDDPQKVEIALGTKGTVFGQDLTPLFTPLTLTPVERELLEDYCDASEALLGSCAEWWDPASTAFNCAAFTQAMRAMA